MPGFATAADGGTFVNTNIYIKLFNSTIDPDMLPKQFANSGPDGIRFLITFLSARCKKLQNILNTLYNIALEIEMPKAMDMLLECVLEATDAKYASLYFTSGASGKLTVKNTNWPVVRENIPIDEVFASSIIFKGERVNVYNIKSSEHFTEHVAEAYQCVEPECILSAPIFGDGMKVAGFVEVVNKSTGNPFFHVEDEFMIKALSSLNTLLFNHANVKQNAIKKTDDIKVFLNTASMMTNQKTDMGDLINVIMQTARELVNAERCTLFMLDRDTEELWSTVAQGSSEIRIPMNKGIAGFVAMTGQTLNIADAYSDSRFNRDVDLRTGFRTRNILCMPMVDHKQEIIGVTQVINKLPSHTCFTKEDEIQLASFSSLAASTIEKQLVFKSLHSSLEEMTRSRRYLASMLQSVNSVVMTLSDDGRLVSINNAEAFDLSGIVSTMRLTSYEHWLGHENAQLIDDIIRAQLSMSPIYGRNVPLQFSGQPTRHVNYFIQKLGYDTVLDSLMEEHKKIRLPSPKAARELTQIAEPTNVSGIIIVIEELTHELCIEENLARKMKPHQVHRLMADPEKLKGEMQPVTTIYADIRSFKTISLSISPKQVTDYLNHFYEIVTNAVNQEGGVILKIVGDSVTAAFGIPFPGTDDTLRAFNTSIKIQHLTDEFNRKHEDIDLPILRIGVGVSQGEALCAAVGPSRSKDYTVIGEPLANAHKLEELTKIYGAPILTFESTRDIVKEQFHLREIDTVRFSDSLEPVTLFEVLASSNTDLAHDVMTVTTKKNIVVRTHGLITTIFLWIK